jgi:hypothetical protein
MVCGMACGCSQKNRAFTFAAILTLAFGIGANTAIWGSGRKFEKSYFNPLTAEEESWDRLALADCQPQDGQVDFSSLDFTAKRTSSELKEIFSIFNRSGAARIVFIHRYFLTRVNHFTNFQPEPRNYPPV